MLLKYVLPTGARVPAPEHRDHICFIPSLEASTELVHDKWPVKSG